MEQGQYQQQPSETDIQELHSRIKATRVTLSSLHPEHAQYLHTKKALLDLEVKLHHIQTQSGGNPNSTDREHGMFTFTPLRYSKSGTRPVQVSHPNSEPRLNVKKEEEDPEFLRSLVTESIDFVVMTDSVEHENVTMPAANKSSKNQSSQSTKLQERLQRIQNALDEEEGINAP
mmetsp:Transcript_11318/g.19328  ORF Transcript_11318/g.19328 Transcript_11318/m.19328 type:complete len:174 (+) Transcript_11318:1249-1770(+)